MKPIVIDRDGVINKESDQFIKTAEEYHLLPGAVGAIKRLNDAGFDVFVASNQSGIGRGIISLENLIKIQKKLVSLLAQHDAAIAAFVFCPHAPEANCQCRKPKPGMVHEIEHRVSESLNGSYFIGDRLSDAECAVNAGVIPLLVSTGKPLDQEKVTQAGYKQFATISEAVDFVLNPTVL